MSSRSTTTTDRDIEALAFAPDEEEEEEDDHHHPAFRPDLIVNGVATLLVGTATTSVIFSLRPDVYGFVGWCLIGTPCCLIAGVSSLLTLLNVRDPFRSLAPGLRCDVKNGSV
jgi:hypothetical protein